MAYGLKHWNQRWVNKVCIAIDFKLLLSNNCVWLSENMVDLGADYLCGFFNGMSATAKKGMTAYLTHNCLENLVMHMLHPQINMQ